MLGVPALAQLPHRADTDTLWCDTTLHHALAHGRLDGHFRLFVMGTVNRGDLSDHHAAAFGGSLGYRSARWHGFRFSLMGGYTFPLFASELHRTDDPGLLPSRYELGLFDVAAHDQHEFVYLHEFNIDFRTRDRRWQFTLGKQHLDEPFLNGQDSRMHPTLFDGLTVQRRGPRNARYELAWIHHVAPRSTSHWYTVGRSIGVYPGQGRDVHGGPSGYGGHLRSAGIFTALGEWAITPRLRLLANDVFVENIFNTVLVQLKWHPTARWNLQLRGIRQDAMDNGGNSAENYAYLPRGAQSNTLTARIEHLRGTWTFRLNATRITAHGRFLMPREWGREPLYTYLSRERNEGLGDVWATVVGVARHHLKPKGLHMQVDAGLYGMPSATDVRINKYTMVPYGHAVLDLRYAFHGLDLRLLYVYKWPLQGLAEHVEAQVYNRVGMHHGSLVVDYHF